MSFSPPCASISFLMGPFLREERMSLLSPQMSLFVQSFICLPEESKSSICTFLTCSLLGSSICSIVWNGKTVFATSLVFPFHTSSTSRSSSKSKNRYFSGNGLPDSKYFNISRFSLSERFIKLPICFIIPENRSKINKHLLEKRKMRKTKHLVSKANQMKYLKGIFTYFSSFPPSQGGSLCKSTASPARFLAPTELLYLPPQTSPRKQPRLPPGAAISPLHVSSPSMEVSVPHCQHVVSSPTSIYEL